MEGGAGMGVLNSLAGRVLHDAGMECVTLDVEGDRKQWEDVSESCPAPCSLVVFGRPPLLVSRCSCRKISCSTKFLPIGGACGCNPGWRGDCGCFGRRRRSIFGAR